ncbi:MAG: class I SAM-dependent methyltransferase [Candidatus Aenigmarchaeota archaeon]|nr:class I SAM-dependent methyltransferase [Candidatus Aenigmarchaeota archaeon]
MPTDEEWSFHLNLRKNRPAYEHEQANYSLLRHLLAFSGKRVLDVGCGQGYLLSKLRKDNVIAGVDYIPDNPYRIPKKVVDLDRDRLPFRPRSFDVIICSNVLEHITRPLHVLQQVKTCLAPGGMAIIALPNEYTLRNKVDFVLGKPLVSHQIDAFGHKYIAGIGQWTALVAQVFPRFRRELRPQRERGIVGMASRLLSPMFPSLNTEQIIFIAER